MENKKINNNLVELFWKLHPEVEDINVAISESGQGTRYKEKRSYDKENIYNLKCSNPCCKKSHWFGINEILNKIVCERKIDWRGQAFCDGLDAGARCRNFANLKIKVKYK